MIYEEDNEKSYLRGKGIYPLLCLVCKSSTVSCQCLFDTERHDHHHRDDDGRIFAFLHCMLLSTDVQRKNGCKKSGKIKKKRGLKPRFFFFVKLKLLLFRWFFSCQKDNYCHKSYRKNTENSRKIIQHYARWQNAIADIDVVKSMVNTQRVRCCIQICNCTSYFIVFVV